MGLLATADPIRIGRAEQCLSILHLQLLGVVDGAIAVHQHHGSGEVEDAGGEDKHS